MRNVGAEMSAAGGVDGNGDVLAIQDDPPGSDFPAICENIKGFALVAPQWDNSPAGHPQQSAERQFRLADLDR